MKKSDSESSNQSDRTVRTNDESCIGQRQEIGESSRSPMMQIGNIGFMTRRYVVVCAVVLFLGSVPLGMVVAQLWWVFAGPPLGVRRTIIIHPFQNLTTDAREDSFCKGLHEELLAELSRKKSDSFDVVIDSDLPGKQAFEKPGNTESIYELGGSVRMEGHTLRIAIELNELQSKRVLWAQLYEGNEENPVPVQRDVATQAAKGILTRL